MLIAIVIECQRACYANYSRYLSQLITCRFSIGAIYRPIFLSRKLNDFLLRLLIYLSGTRIAICLIIPAANCFYLCLPLFSYLLFYMAPTFCFCTFEIVRKVVYCFAEWAFKLHLYCERVREKSARIYLVYRERERVEGPRRLVTVVLYAQV